MLEVERVTVNTSELEALEHQLAEQVELVKVKDMIDRLNRNEDFRKLILTDFMVREAATNVQISADPARTEKEQQAALGMAQAAGHLKRYLYAKGMMAMAAQETIESIRENIQILRQEGES